MLTGNKMHPADTSNGTSMTNFSVSVSPINDVDKTNKYFTITDSRTGATVTPSGGYLTSHYVLNANSGAYNLYLSSVPSSYAKGSYYSNYSYVCWMGSPTNLYSYWSREFYFDRSSETSSWRVYTSYYSDYKYYLASSHTDKTEAAKYIDSQGCIRDLNQSDYPGQGAYLHKDTGAKNLSRYDMHDACWYNDGETLYSAELDFQIYAYRANISIEVAPFDDASIASEVESGALNVQQTKPTYDDYTDVSGAVDVEARLGDAQGGFIDASQAEYMSDASTSNIETVFGKVYDADGNLLEYDASDETVAQAYYDAQQQNDGRIVTDKSVVYGDDDYNAFDNYAEGEYSETLSALGQEWVVEDEKSIETPIDVVFMLDLSDSMNREKASLKADETQKRWEAGIDSINYAMDEILSRNSDNRVGLVAFSDGVVTAFGLDRYTLSSGSEYITYTAGDPESVKTAAGLKDGAGNAVAQKSLNKANGMWYNTYTQGALQEAYNAFASATPNVVIEGETVYRKPVFILVTDGSPTIGTSNYMNPQRGPLYGTGGDYGILGYYSVLSAKYFKNLTSLHYNNQAAFYSIGTGVYANDADLKVLIDQGYSEVYTVNPRIALNQYERSVFDPSATVIDALSSSAYNNDSDWSFEAITWREENLLYQALMKNDLATLSKYFGFASLYDNYNIGYSDKNIWPTVHYMFTSGVINSIPNPYYNPSDKAGYGLAYADDAYFGHLSAADMKDIFDEIMIQVQAVNNYGFLLQNNSDLVITDPLGDGMAVKSYPVLRYWTESGCVNYAPTNAASPAAGTDTAGNAYVEYVYDYKVYRAYSDSKWDAEQTNASVGTSSKWDATQKKVFVDLSGVRARITTDAKTGAQMLTFTIPEAVVPTFYPDLHKSFYYEELPIRLIYKVGLSSAELADIASQQTEVERTYYTNAVDTGADGTKVAQTYATFTPAASNKYYTANTSSSVAKVGSNGTAADTDANITGTAANSLTESTIATAGGDTFAVTQTLGNNGKLTVSYDPLKDAPTVVVQKVWPQDDDAAEHDPVVVDIYRTISMKTDSGSTLSVDELMDTIMLDARTDWKATLRLPIEATSLDGSLKGAATYYVAERSVAGYTAIYTDGAGQSLASADLTWIRTAKGMSIEKATVYAMANKTKIEISNVHYFALPEAGGQGLFDYTAGGLALMAGALAALCIYRRTKLRTRGIGGERA
jgi:hypothetical protein